MSDDSPKPINDGTLPNDPLRLGEALIDDSVDSSDNDRTVTYGAGNGLNIEPQHNKHDGQTLATGGLGIHVMDNQTDDDSGA